MDPVVFVGWKTVCVLRVCCKLLLYVMHLLPVLQENGVKDEYGLTEKGIAQAKDAGFVPLKLTVYRKALDGLCIPSMDAFLVMNSTNVDPE